jgi:O-antigen/teichoic acid export membrane protein
VIKFFFNSYLTYNIGNVLTLSLALCLLPIYSRYLSPEEFGIVDIFLVISTFVNLTLALEISQGLGRFYQETKKQKDKKEYVSTAFWFTIFIYLLFLIFCFFFSEIFTFWLFLDASKQDIFLLAIVAIMALKLFNFTQSLLRWQIQPKYSVFVNLVYFLVLASVTLYLLIIRELKVESVFIGQITGSIIASFLAFLFARRSYGFTFSLKKFKRMVSYSAPLVLSSISVVIATNIDRIAIKDLLGLEELGIYGVAYRFATVTGLVIIGFQESLTPLIFKFYKNKKTPFEISNIFNIFIVFALFTFTGSILFSKEIIILFTTEPFYGSANLISILIMAIFFSHIFIFMPGLSIAKKTKLIFLTTTSGAILNVILNYKLIPVFGLSGAAYATLISSIGGFILYLLLSNKYYPIPFKFKSILTNFIILLIANYIVVNIFDEINLKSIFFKNIYLFLVLIVTSLFLIEKKYIQKIKLIFRQAVLKK